MSRKALITLTDPGQRWREKRPTSTTGRVAVKAVPLLDAPVAYSSVTVYGPDGAVTRVISVDTLRARRIDFDSQADKIKADVAAGKRSKHRGATPWGGA